jgi:hypothetical protein
MSISERFRRLVGLPERQRWPMDPSRASVAVCESEGWYGFMVEVLYPDACRIPLAPGTPARDVLAAIPPTSRGALLNINLSYAPDFIDSDAEFRDLAAQRGLPLLNAHACDVRKRTMHERSAGVGIPTARACQAGPPDERVIVKTTLNYGGKPERLMRERWGDRAARFTTDVNDTVHTTLDYRIYRRAEVPAHAWSDSSLVVERYITNPDGLFIRAYVVGSAGVVTLAHAASDIKKLSLPQSDRRDFYFWDAIPLGPTSDIAARALATARRLASALQIDFCGVDCAVDADGTVIPVDVNKTPYWGHPRQSPVLAHLRHGFNALIGDFT